MQDAKGIVTERVPYAAFDLARGLLSVFGTMLALCTEVTRLHGLHHVT